MAVNRPMRSVPTVLQISTLELESSQRSGLAGGRDVRRLETVYQRYKRELLEPNISHEHSFSLLQELHASLQRHADLKKYFWKASESHRTVAKLSLQLGCDTVSSGGVANVSEQYSPPFCRVEVNFNNSQHL